MRILIVSHPPLATELGAAQIALRLAEALRERGHDAMAWSPEPLPPDTRWWNLWRRQTRAAELFAAANGPFDVIDTPALSASRRLSRHGRLVARSVQPELRYLLVDVRSDLAERLSPGSLAHAVVAVPRAAAILGGWRRASRILCLGTLELEWMRRRHPRWAGKLGLYVCGLPPEWLRSGRVRLVPSFPRTALPELLASHDAGLFTSEVEGWGLSLAEMLESGLPVYATEAGAVADLRPYFPGSLRPFPPPAEIAPAPAEDLEAGGYYERFSWPAVARSYEEQVLR